MERSHDHPLRPHLRAYLAAGYMMFIAYVSLTPLGSWQDQGLSFLDVLTAPLAQTYTGFDFSLNLLSYLVAGFLFASVLRAHCSTRSTILLGTFAGLLLSICMEFLQLYLPSRYSSNTDIISNTLGAFLGTLLYFRLAASNLFVWLKQFHEARFKHEGIHEFGLALVALWLFAQTNPSLPMLGSMFIHEIARWPFDIVPEKAFSLFESSEVALNLLMLGILLSAVLRERRLTFPALLILLGLITLVKFLAAALLLKSWALLIWLDAEALLGMVTGLLLLAALLRLPQHWLPGLGVLACLLYLVLLQDLLLGNHPVTPRRLFHWHYIHLMNYNGFSQLIILLFPILLLAFLIRAAMRQKE